MSAALRLLWGQVLPSSILQDLTLWCHAMQNAGRQDLTPTSPQEVQRMLGGFIKYLRRSDRRDRAAGKSNMTIPQSRRRRPPNPPEGPSKG
jgi:hypothetical protein